MLCQIKKVDKLSTKGLYKKCVLVWEQREQDRKLSM